MNGHQLHYQQSTNSTTANNNNNSFLTAGPPIMRNGCGMQPITPDHKMQHGRFIPQAFGNQLGTNSYSTGFGAFGANSNNGYPGGFAGPRGNRNWTLNSPINIHGQQNDTQASPRPGGAGVSNSS